MRKVMHTLERVGWGMAILGLCLRLGLLVGGNLLLILGLSTLSIVSFLWGFFPGSRRAADETSLVVIDNAGTLAPAARPHSFLLDTLLPKLMTQGSAIVFIGTLFKLMNWNGSAPMLQVGAGMTVLAVVLQALNQRLETRVLLVAALGGIMLAIPSEDIVRQFHRYDPVLVEKMVYQIQYPQDPAAAEAVRQHIRQKRAQR